MLIYLDVNKSVETKGDECNPVGNEIGTFPQAQDWNRKYSPPT